jgi:NADH-quinone oxidoreductase subunit L
VLPVTTWTFLVATLAIAGFPPFAGFFSKDQILHSAFAGGTIVLWLVGLLTAVLTAFYMFRVFYLAFHGDYRGDPETLRHAHESPPVMTWPLRILALGAILAGWLGIPAGFTFGFDLNLFDRFIEPMLAEVEGLTRVEHEVGHLAEILLLLVSVGAAFGGWLVARKLFGFRRGTAADDAFAARAPRLRRLLANKWYVDELYDATVVRGTWAAARGLFRFDSRVIDGFFVNGSRNVTVALALLSGFFDKYVVDGLVNLVGVVASAWSRLFRRLQTGVVSQYALVLTIGMFVLLCFYLVLLRTT